MDNLFALTIDPNAIDWITLLAGAFLGPLAARIPQLAPLISMLSGLLHRPAPTPLGPPTPVAPVVPAPQPQPMPLTLEQCRQLLRAELTSLLAPLLGRPPVGPAPGG